MKFCPKCNSTFTGSETFCPTDGTRLEEPRRGELVGATLGNAVKLEVLEFADVMAERYAGRLLEGKRPCYVTVFNRKFSPAQNAPRLVETARAKVGTPVPRQLSSLLQVRFDHFPAFVIETAPRGPSLKDLLDARKRLDWAEAVRIACNVARIVEWLFAQGLAHHSLHPATIYVTDLTRGQVQLGQWYSEEAQWVDNPLQTLATTPERFVGYVAYMAPELAYHARGADLRSAVYALGVLIYELIVGTPPFQGDNPADILRSQLTELPPKLSDSGVVVPPDLEQIVEMMLSKAPDSRFQAPAAIVAALASLVGEEPDLLAPPVLRDEEQEENDHYATIEMSSVDRDSLPGIGETVQLLDRPHSQTMLSPVALNQQQELAAAGEPEVDSAEISSPDSGIESAPVEAVAPVEDDPVEAVAPVKEDAPVEEDAPVKEDAPVEAVASVEEDAPVKEDASAEAIAPVGEDAPESVDEEEDEDRDRTGMKTLMMGNVGEIAGLDARRNADEDEEPTKEGSEAAKVEVEEPKVVVGSLDELEKKDPVAQEAVSEPGPRESAEFDAMPVHTESGPKLPVSAFLDGPMEIGSLAPKNPETTTDDWFSGTTESAWDEAVAEDLAEKAKTSNRLTVVGVVAAMLIAGIGFYLWVNYGAVVEEPVVVAEKQEPVAKAVEVDLSEITGRFKKAMDDGRVIRPLGNSAMSALNELKGHGADKPEYQTARDEFVKHSQQEAEKAYAAGDLNVAQQFAGYASEFSPEDNALRELAERYHAEYRTSLEAPAPETDLGLTDTGADAAPVEKAPEVEPDKEPEEIVRVEPKTKVEPKAKVEPKKKVEPKTDTAANGNAASLLADARSAYSRGDLSRAQNLYTELLKIDGKNHLVHAGLGQVFFDRALYNDAVKHQQQALKLRPGRAEYQINLGQSFYRLGRFQDAINIWQEVLKKEPENKNAKQYIELAKRRLN